MLNNNCSINELSDSSPKTNFAGYIQFNKVQHLLVDPADIAWSYAIELTSSACNGWEMDEVSIIENAISEIVSDLKGTLNGVVDFVLPMLTRIQSNQLKATILISSDGCNYDFNRCLNIKLIHQWSSSAESYGFIPIETKYISQGEAILLYKDMLSNDESYISPNESMLLCKNFKSLMELHGVANVSL